MTRTSYCRTTGLLLVSLALAATSTNANIYVNASCGDDAKAGTSADCAAPDGPKLTIQAGADVAGSTWVIVAPGTYHERVKNLANHRLRSSGGAEVTIIDGSSGAGHAVVSYCDRELCFTTGLPGFTLVGFTVTGGGDGIEATSYGTTIRDCIVTGNSTA